MFIFRTCGRAGSLIMTGLLGLAASSVQAQMPVAVGAGSIASAPPAYKAKTEPAGPGFNATAMLSRKIYADEFQSEVLDGLEVPGRPIPTNDWWTDIINNQFSGALWSYPAMLHTSEEGLRVSYPSYWADMGKEIKSRSSLTVGGHRYRASATIARNWHDWDVVFGMPATDGSGEMTVTAVHGMPFTWIEYSGDITPEISFSATPELFATSSGMTGIKLGDDLYGLYYPAKATAMLTDDNTMQLRGEPSWLVVALLRSEEELTAWNRYATSIPRATEVSWNYDEPTARVATSWQVTAENLRNPGAQAPVMQGFLPHAYKYALAGANLHFTDDLGFMTPRGTMKLAVSNDGSFAYSYQFSGMLPTYAAPAEGDGFRPEVLEKLMRAYASRGSFGADTYWGGKGLVQMALNMTFAREAGNSELYQQSLTALRNALTNWLTYTPGEDNFFFSYYPRWGGMLGFDVSYDSDAFNDHHFHYGYFTYAAALLCMEDPAFAAQYGDLLTMIAKDYANWDRADKRFPFMRTFDPWSGHSWAGGLGDHGNDNGNGQESSSEAMQSWGGLYFLGVALGNKEMRDAGLWGWNTEARATREYWYDVDTPRPANAGGRKAWTGKGNRQGNYKYDEYPYAYNSNITGKGIGWWTWFGGDPLFMHGIQWMPASPALDYLSWDPDFCAWAFDDMMSGANSTFSHSWFEPTVNSDNGEAIEPLAANDWGNVALSYLQRSNPREAARVFDEALSRNMHIATAVSTGHISYYVTHSHLTYGDPDFSIHADIPTAQVCRRADGTTTYIVYNPDADDRTVSFYNASGAMVKQVTAPARKLAAISADPEPREIEYTLEGGAIIPPGDHAMLATTVRDQYGAAMKDEEVTAVLSRDAPARLERGQISVNAGARRSDNFTLTLSCGELQREVVLTVNDRPAAKSAVISGVPEICERDMTFTPLLTVTDQYGNATTPADTHWTLTPESGEESAAGVPVKISRAGRYTLKASVAATDANPEATAETRIFVAPPLPLLSKGAPVAASSAENVGSMPAGATDGDPSVRWGSAHTDNEWIVVDLGENCYLSRVSIIWEAAFASRYELQLAPDGVPMKSLEVNYAGGKHTVSVPVESAWTTVTEEHAASAGEKTTALNASGRYLRMRGLERGSAYGYSLYELSAYGLRESMAPGDVIGVDFGLPSVADRDATITLNPRAFTNNGDVKSDISVSWNADKAADFAGNSFTPRSHGMYRLTATLAGNDGLSSQASIFVNDVERPASVALDRTVFTAIEGDDLAIPFTVMNQYLAPFRGNADDLTITVKDSQGNPAAGVTYDAADMTLHTSATSAGSYTLDFGGLASCRVEVKPLREVNLALGKEATASGSNGDNKPALAVDGNADTRWESVWADSQTLTVDLGEPYLIDRANILWEGAYARAYRLQTSVDGEHWYDFYSETDSKGGLEKLSFNAVACRYLRLACDRRALTAYGSSVKELEVYGISRFGNGDDSRSPSVTQLDYTTGNGSLSVTAAVSHPSGSAFATVTVENAAGDTVGSESRALTSKDAWTMDFSDLRTGNYTVTLTASDAFGHETTERLDGIHVTYSIAGINPALGKTASASSSENEGLGDRYAVDGNMSTRWGSKFNDDEYITVDLGMPYLLTDVRIYWNEPAYATDYSVMLSLTGKEDDFTEAASRTGWTSHGEPDNLAIDREEPFRFVRVIGHRRATGYGTSINELEVYGKDFESAVDVITDADAPERWYTIDGHCLPKPPTAPGIYIRVKGGAATKIRF